MGEERICKCENRQNTLFYIDSSNDSFIVTFIHIDCEQIIKKVHLKLAKNDSYEVVLEEVKVFYSTGMPPPKIAIFRVISDNFMKQYKFKEYLKRYCTSKNINYQFIDLKNLMVSSILCGVNIDLPKHVLLLNINTNKMYFYELFEVDGVYKLQSTKFALLSEADKIRDTVFINHKYCEKIILAFYDPSLIDIKYYENFLKCEKLVVLKNSFLENVPKALISMVKDLNGTQKSIFKTDPKFDGNLVLLKRQTIKPHHGYVILTRWYESLLPYARCVNVEILENEELCISAISHNGSSYELIQTFFTDSKGFPNVLVNFVVDKNGFYSIVFKPINLNNILPFPSFPENLTVEMILCESFMSINLKEFNISCIDNRYILPYISFKDNPIVIGQEAKKIGKKYPSFVVYDLLKIIKVIYSDALPKPDWKFKIEKNSDGVSYIIFDTWRGKRKATPQFLLAILIDHMLKFARTKLGFKPQKVRVLINSILQIVVKDIAKLACEILNV
uniref:Early transcription factor 82 kDa subunit n=1 Tax=Panagrolaimus sp. ES5 TaxID=591445 RepID=A0AC34FT00_9BILA